MVRSDPLGCTIQRLPPPRRAAALRRLTMSSPARKRLRIFLVVLSTVLVLLGIAQPLCAQTTVGTGSIVGTVSDPSGAVISGARVTITNVAMGQDIYLLTNSSGAFSSVALVPGNYKTQVSAKGF